MPTITLRLDGRTKDDLDALAAVRNTTISEMVRLQVVELLGRETEREVPGGQEAPIHLSLVDRRILSLLHTVLRHLDDDPAIQRHHERRAEIFDAGFAAEYADEFISVEPELTPRQCEFVWDVLDMFTHLQMSTARLGSAAVAALDEHAEAFLSLRGFDLNDSYESHLLSYCKHLLASERWTNLAEYFNDKHERGNSHMRMIPSYERMLEVYLPMKKARVNSMSIRTDEWALTAEELGGLVTAAIHPDHRQ
jgi:uncharacterized protein YfbU (UPF0304 family)